MTKASITTKRQPLITPSVGSAQKADVMSNCSIASPPVIECVPASTHRPFGSVMIPNYNPNMERAWERRNDWEAMRILAAKRVRELVPPDPVAVFVKELQELIV